MIRIQVRLFARAREAYGRSEVTLELPSGATASECMQALVAEAPALDGLRSSLLVARNEEYAEWTAPLADGDVIALIPPVSGG